MTVAILVGLRVQPAGAQTNGRSKLLRWHLVRRGAGIDDKGLERWMDRGKTWLERGTISLLRFLSNNAPGTVRGCQTRIISSCTNRISTSQLSLSILDIKWAPHSRLGPTKQANAADRFDGTRRRTADIPVSRMQRAEGLLILLPAHIFHRRCGMPQLASFAPVPSPWRCQTNPPSSSDCARAALSYKSSFPITVVVDVPAFRPAG